MELLAVLLALVAIAGGFIIFWTATKKKPGRNPFATDFRREPAAHVADHRVRDAVLKNGFTAAKVQENGPFDVIIIGSGMGGLTTAVLLARAGKKVLVLEQHDQAGGCCHTFYEKGYEFDTGIHYIGEIRNNTLVRFMLQQLTGGQLLWTDMDKAFDIILLGSPDIKEGVEKIPMVSGKEDFINNLVQHFPDERAAIVKFVNLLQQHRRAVPGGMTTKLLSPWSLRLMKMLGLVDRFTPYFKMSKRSLQEVMDEITSNDKLKAVLSYCYGDYGTPPNEASFGMHCTLLTHFLYGVSYPRGGPSEIAFHMIPEIERGGGQVMVRAKVDEILLSPSGSVSGVRVSKGGGGAVDIPCKTVISTAGVFNTFEQLLPDSVQAGNPHVDKLLNKLRHSCTCFSLFVGLKKSSADLQLPAASYWCLPSIDLNKDFKAYMEMDAIEASTAVPPVLFISFPSAKDSTWDERFPGKSNALVIVPGMYDWFAEWEDERVMKRSAEYSELKAAFQETIWKRTCALLPQLEDAVDYLDLGTPVTNKHYLNSPQGEIYAADHDTGRFDFDTFSQLRPETCVPGLFLSGQDVLTCGFAGAMFGGALSAGAVLNRNLMADMIALRAAVSPTQSSFPMPTTAATMTAATKDKVAKKNE